MDLLLNRFRNLTVVVIVIAAQLLLLAYQVKSNQEIRLVRVWAVTAVTPLARVIEGVRGGTTRFFTDYFYLLDVRDENRRMKAELGRIKLENQFLKTELSTADRARALAQFQSRSPSRTVAARIIGNGTGANSKVVFIDRGSSSGVLKGMAVITPDGIVGKVVESFPVAAQVLLITDPTFAAGVISQKNHARGTLKGKGLPTCLVDYVQNEEKVDLGEWFYTTGDDRVFPRGLPVGQVTSVHEGKSVKEIYVVPSGFQNGFEEVLVVLEGVHQAIPEPQTASAEAPMLPPPPPDKSDAEDPSRTGAPGTDADKMLDRYRRIGEAQGHTYGEGVPGSKPPNFNINPDDPKFKQTQPATTSGQPPTPAATQPQLKATPKGATAPAPPISNPQIQRPKAVPAPPAQD
jgi:rod shape-determining protein MreC